MGLVIEELRKEVGFDGYEYNEAITELLVDVWKPEGYSVEVVEETFEDGGRWSNYRTTVYKVVEGEDVAYFEVVKEEPATEQQDGGDFSMWFSEVVPREVVITKYVSK